MPWAYIRSILGAGLHWQKTRQEFNDAIDRAERDGQHDAADHIRIMLRLRNKVMMDDYQKETLPKQGQMATTPTKVAM